MTAIKVFIKLSDFLKLSGAVESGGDAKVKIQGGQVKVNGATERRRGKKLVLGDQVLLNEISYLVSEKDLDTDAT